MNDPTLTPCTEPAFVKDRNQDRPSSFCNPKVAERSSGTITHKPHIQSQQDVSSTDFSWLEDATQSKLGNGHEALCDEQQSGHIINEQGMSPPNRDVVYRYSKSLRGTDEAMVELFKDIIVIDEEGKAHNVPIIWGTQEKAVAFMLQENVRKDQSLVVDRIRLPILAIHSSAPQINTERYIYHKAIDYLKDHNGNPTFTTNEKYEKDTVFGVTRGIPVDVGYTLYAWTMYEEDMNQILTQIITKFSPIAYIRVKGISWETIVKLDNIADNINYEPGDKSIRVIKYQFGLTAETFVSQPIVRKKAVLSTHVEVANSINLEESTEILARLEDAVKERKNVRN